MRAQAQVSVMSRRTVLRGAGVTMALPWLESLSVWGADTGSAAAAPPGFPRPFALLFMANGINPKHWWARGAGRGMNPNRSHKPMVPLKHKLNVVSGLFNKNATGVGIHPGQTGNILSGVSLQKGAVLRGGISVDQVLAGR